MVFWNLPIRFYMISFTGLLYQNTYGLTQSPERRAIINGLIVFVLIFGVWAYQAYYLKRADPLQLDR